MLEKSFYVVIPAYNEGPAIARVIAELRECHPNVSIVVVDDGSQDDTVEVLRSCSVAIAIHPINLGQGAALQTGITFALRHGAKHIATFDADGQHDPNDLTSMRAMIDAQGLDVVLGSRFLGQATDHIPAFKRLVLRLATAFTTVSTGLALTDTHNGLRVLTREFAAKLEITQDRMAHASEILTQIARMKARFAEAPVHIRYSEYSIAKGQRASNAVNILWDLFFRG